MTERMRNFLVFCHFALPGIFITTAATLHGYPNFLTWQVVVVLAIACLPIILPLLAFYVKGIGKDGVMMNNVFTGSVTAPTEPAEQPNEQPDDTTTSRKKIFADYSTPAKKVLRTLWRFQHEQFNEDYSQRWAFGVHPASMDYPKFHAAYRELTFDGLINMGPKGLVFLSNTGVDFCKANKDSLKKGDVWDSFDPV